MGRLAGKIALITGGNSGIGLASAKAFTAEGAKFIRTSAKICRAAVRSSTAHIGHAVGGVSLCAAFKITNVTRFPSGGNSSVARRRRLHISTNQASMIKMLGALTAVMAIGLGTAAAIKLNIFAVVEPVAALSTSTISIEELHRQVNMSTLPVTKIKHLY